MEWRPNCFFCEEKLFVSMQFTGYRLEDCEKPEFFIEDELLHFRSDFMEVSVDIISGFVQSNSHPVEMTSFLARNTLELKAKCLQCLQDGRVYAHMGTYGPDARFTHFKMTDLSEVIVNGNIYFQQSQTKQIAIISTLSEKDDKLLKSSGLSIPYIDLSKIKPETLANKIKTYITFS